MKFITLITSFALTIAAAPLAQSYSTTQSYGSSYTDDGSGHPQGQAWGNAYGSSSVTNPQGYTVTNTGGNDYYSPLNTNQIGQLVQNNLAQSANIKAALNVLAPPIVPVPVAYPAPPTTAY
jgi:hypothetical protein